MDKSLRGFIENIGKEGELLRVKVKVSPEEEITEIVDRVSKSSGGGRALLFEDSGTAFPLLINMFGSQRRMAMALGVENLSQIAHKIDTLIKKVTHTGGSLFDKMALLPLLKEASQWLPRSSKRRGKCQEVILQGEDVDLDKLPILKCWAHDGGRFITLPLVHTVHPETGVRNVGMYRMQVFDKKTTGMHWHIHKTGARHYDAYKRLGKHMPVSVCLGGNPIYTYSATAPLPEGIDEYILAGFLNKKPVKLVKCVTNDIYVPSDCDFVIEGYVDTAEEKVIEGPFGDHTGFYSLEELYPLFHVTAITHRKDAIYPATVVGVPPMEDAYIAKATESIFLAPIRLVIQPEITDMYMPSWGVAHNFAIINIDYSYVGQAHKVASSLWGAGQMMFNKYLFITSTDENIRDQRVIERLLSGVDMEKAVIRSQGVLDVLDHSTATIGFGGKLAIDLTNSQPNPNNNSKIEILVDKGAEHFTDYQKWWLATANSDPTRDAKVENGVLVIDGRTKKPGEKGNPLRFPNIVTSSCDIIELVDKRWEEYGLGEFIPSPSLIYKPLIDKDKAEI